MPEDNKIEEGFDKIKEGVMKKKNEAKQNQETNDVNDKNNVNVKEDGTITITSKEKEEKLKRTYYIDPDNANKIDWASRKTGRDKSEIVRIALNYFFENAEIK